MISFKSKNWKSFLGLLLVAGALTGCASSGNPLAKLSPSSIKKAYNRQRTGMEDPAAVHKSYAEFQESQGNLVDARKSYNVVLEHDSKSIDSILGLARLDQLAGNPDKAEEQIQRAQAIAPNDPRVKVSLGKLYMTQGRFEEAVDELKQASLHSPNDNQIQYQLAVALARSGDIEASRPYFIRTVGEAESHFNIAYILNEQGQWVGAEQELMASLQKKPQLQDSQLLLEKIRREHAPQQQMLAQQQQQQQYVDPNIIAAQQMAMQQQLAYQQQMAQQQQQMYAQQQQQPQMGPQPQYGVQGPAPQGAYQGQYPAQPYQQASGQQQNQQPVQQLSSKQVPGQQNVRDAYWQQKAGQPSVNPFQQLNGQQPGAAALPQQQQQNWMPTINAQ